MPIKNRIKIDQAGGIYYIYNKGIDGKMVFQEPRDYEFFEKTMARYLDYQPKITDSRFKAERPYILRHREQMNLKDKLVMMAYCLNPTEVKFIVSQNTTGAMTQFMRRCMTNYVMYYNNKYQRRGILFEGPYRAALIKDPEEILMMSKWLHLNKTDKTVRRFGIVETSANIDPEEYLYSSYSLYNSKRTNSWLDVGRILNMFDLWNNGRWKNYQDFVNDSKLNLKPLLEKLGVE